MRSHASTPPPKLPPKLEGLKTQTQRPHPAGSPQPQPRPTCPQAEGPSSSPKPKPQAEAEGRGPACSGVVRQGGGGVGPQGRRHLLRPRGLDCQEGCKVSRGAQAYGFRGYPRRVLCTAPPDTPRGARHRCNGVRHVCGVVAHFRGVARPSARQSRSVHGQTMKRESN
eukprot:2279509-Prymnesium_polylepis.1